MISRRNIRVKVMQTLYSAATCADRSGPGNPESILKNHFEQTRGLLVYLTNFLAEICLYAHTDAQHRAAKHLPTYEDLHVNTKISSNRIILKILNDPSFGKAVKNLDNIMSPDRELLKKIYQQLKETDEYKIYTLKENLSEKEEKDILEYILEKLMLENPGFISHLEESFINWDDDGEMIIQLLAGIIQKPGHMNFQDFLRSEKSDFAFRLLTTVLEKDEYLQKFIIPRLKNWDPDRIALLDMILMKMGVAEFLYFETIPPKVTINEYIDLAKEYSTGQSGQFVNGILDNIHKELIKDGTMNKVDYKKA